VSDAVGHWATDTVSITVLDVTSPTAIAGDDQTVQPKNPATFDAGSSGDNVGLASYEWDFGDGSTGIGMTTTHTYFQPGTYTVILTVKDSAGNTSKDTLTVTVLAATEAFPIWIIGIVALAITVLTIGAIAMRKRKT
jgi:PKD repeat protein